MDSKVHGTVDGVPITDEVIERLVANAEAGFPGVTTRRAPGRPALGDDPARPRPPGSIRTCIEH